jgi:prevent-host-death family protein
LRPPLPSTPAPKPAANICIAAFPEIPYNTEYKESAMASTVTAAQISKNFGAYQDAAVREPVIITKNGRPRTVLMAYEDFQRLARRDRIVQRTVDLTPAEIAEVEASEMEPGYEYLDAELTSNAAK